MPSAVRLLSTMICASAPASVMARALSYSQFVPGKTGISTRGRAVLTAGARRSASGALKVSMGMFSAGACVG